MPQLSLVYIGISIDLCRHFPHYWDLVYYFSKNGRELRQACAIVHKFSMDVIKKRRKELEEVTTIHNRREQMHIYLINCNRFKFELMNVFKILKD